MKTVAAGRNRVPVRAVALAAVMVFLIAQPAFSASAEDRDRIVISGPVEVASGESVRNVFVFQGSAAVGGRVDGKLVVLDGPVEVSGVVTDGVVALTGPVTLQPGARIEGDLVHSGRLDSQPGSVITGDTKDIGQGVRGGDVSGGLFFPGRAALWLGVTVSAYLLGLLILLMAPRLPGVLTPVAKSRSAAALGWGLLMFFGLPLAVLICFFSVLGIPLGVVLLLGLPVLYLTGYAVSAMVLGAVLLRSSPGRRVLAFSAGLAALRITALIPMLAGLVWFAATAFGLGVMAVAAWSGRRPVQPPVAPDPAPAPATAA